MSAPTEPAPYIVFPGEAEAMIQSLNVPPLSEYGHDSWYQHHNKLAKLNMQAIASARCQSDEYVKEYFVNHEAISTLVNDLAGVELWIERVFKRLKNDAFEPSSTFPIYSILYHELVLTNLLETMTFHADTVEVLSDASVDLSDWCYRRLCRLVTIVSMDSDKMDFLHAKEPVAGEGNLDELLRQQNVLTFETGMKAVSLVRHLIDHSCASQSVLPLGLFRRLLNTHDLPLVLCHLLELSPWSAVELDKQTGKPVRLQWQTNGSWVPEDQLSSPMNKTEALIWLSLYQILLVNNSVVKYDCSQSHRRVALLRLRPLLTEVRLDVLPILVDLRRYLEQLSLTEGTSSVGPGYSSAIADVCLVELIPEYREALLKKHEKKWRQLATSFRSYTESDEGKQAAMKAGTHWVENFSEEHLDKLCLDTSDFGDDCNPSYRRPHCVVCGVEASKRCSRCRNEWYCRRECQVKHWPKHKSACDLLSQALNDNKHVND